MLIAIFFLSLFYVIAGSELCQSYPFYVEFGSPSDVASFFRDKQPTFDIINCIDDGDCCICDNEAYYLCSSIDNLSNYNISNDHHAALLMYVAIGREDETKIINLSRDFQFIKFRYTDIFVLQGFGNVSIKCSDEQALSMGHACGVLIKNVAFTDCGGSAVNEESSRPSSALTLYNMIHIVIDSVKFFRSKGSGLHIEKKLKYDKCDLDSVYNIINSEFNSNGHESISGGGLHINSKTDIVVNINNTTFISNTADIGGGLYHEADHVSCSGLQFSMSNCTFANNKASVHGGAMYYSGANGMFNEISFTSNNVKGRTGGAVYLFVDYPIYDDCQSENVSQIITFDSCFWDGNKATGSSALLATSKSNVYNFNPSEYRIVLQNCAITNNFLVERVFFGQTACVFYIINTPIHLSNVTFAKNNATALCLESTIVTFSDNNIFDRNSQAYLGGAMYISNAEIAFKKGSKVNFTSNSAIYGGALYQAALPYQFNDTKCLFVFENDSEIASKTSILFKNNFAFSSGDSIYFLNPSEDCTEEVNDIRVNYIPDQTESQNQVSSEAFDITFSSPIIMNENGDYMLNIILGQHLIFNASVLNYFNISSFALVTMILQRRDDLISLNDPYSIIGFHQFSIASGINHPNIYINGPEVHNTNDLYKIVLYSQHVTASIDLVINKCPSGFYYKTSQNLCMCIENSKIKCDITSAKACISDGYWLGNVKNTTVVGPCNSRYCKNKPKHCTPCPLENTDSSCLLQEDQCTDNRDGVLCSECKANFSFTFGSTICVDDASCSHGQSLIPLLLNLIFIVITFVVIILVLKLDYKLNSGHIYCYVYYFSIIDHLLPSTADNLLILVSVLESITQLNPQFLGFIPICFWQNLTALEQQMFLYVNPLVISILVLSIILLSKCCCSKQIFKDNTVVKAICLLLLLSFTSLTESSLNIFTGISFTGINKAFVYIQPSTEYLDPAEHLPWFLIATVVLIGFIIPFTLLLLFAPLIARWINLNKIKPFLDEFQSCYKDKFRWMAGYYFTCRLLYFILLTVPISEYVVTEYFLQFLSITILIVHMLIQPYESKWLNICDSLLLIDIVLITLLYGVTANDVFKYVEPLRDVITYFLILIPVVYLIAVILITALKKKCGDRLKSKIHNRKKVSSLKEPLVSVTEISTDDRDRSISVNVAYRDPIMGILESDNMSYSQATVEDSDSNRTVRTCTVSQTIIESPRSINERPASHWVTFENDSENDD
jgi:hypothetical protein